MIYEVTKLPDSLNRIITEVEEFTNHEFQLDFNKKFTSNLTYETGLDGQSIYESQYFWQGIQLDIEAEFSECRCYGAKNRWRSHRSSD